MLSFSISRYPSSTFGQYIRKAMLEKGLTQKAVAEVAEVDVMTILKGRGACSYRPEASTKLSNTTRDREWNCRKFKGDFHPARACSHLPLASEERRITGESAKRDRELYGSNVCKSTVYPAAVCILCRQCRRISTGNYRRPKRCRRLFIPYPRYRMSSIQRSFSTQS